MSFLQKLKGPNKLYAVIVYLLLWALLGTLVIYLTLIITSNIYGVELGRISNYYFTKKIELTENEIKAYYTGLGIGNAITYLFMAIGVVFYLRDEFVLDFLKIKNNKKFYSIFIPLTTIGFCIILFCITKWWPSAKSNNQETTELILKYDGFIPMILATMFLAPIAEECIYRKCIFHFLRAFPIYIAYIVSSLIFAMVHMLSSTGDFKNWILMFIPYLISGVLLAAIYHSSKKNIYASIIAHMANNIMAVILLFI